jgi:hypothetical protein
MGGRTNKGTDTTCYKIVVRGELSEHFAPGFEGMDLKVESGRTVLVGEVVDQSHLHGLIYRIRDFGLELLSVEVLSESEEG